MVQAAFSLTVEVSKVLLSFLTDKVDVRTTLSEQDLVLTHMWLSLGFSKPLITMALKSCIAGSVSTPTTTIVSVFTLAMPTFAMTFPFVPSPLSLAVNAEVCPNHLANSEVWVEHMTGTRVSLDNSSSFPHQPSPSKPFRELPPSHPSPSRKRRHKSFSLLHQPDESSDSSLNRDSDTEVPSVLKKDESPFEVVDVIKVVS